MKKFILAASIVLTGCAAGPDNVDALKKIDYKDQFTVNTGYQQIYRNFKNAFTKCGGMESRWLKPIAVDAELYTDINEGQFTVNIVPTVGQPKPMTYISIKEKSIDSSVVTVYYRWQEHLQQESIVYRRWANGDLTCE
ncbi:hypothetical protein [Endozoicomonas sp. ONNA2]|uniref:hypothetical protein n=1 Tax=Endozoicomonas sp. ONNA2 TaxID=2828741 RepID=UPI00214971DC|nr:hypothetical protein [Endozoicomonas sp. ONNA2]